VGAPVRSKSGGPTRREALKKLFLVVPLHFLTLKAQLVVLVSAFVMVSTVWSVSCLLFFYSRAPRAQPFVKVGGGGTCPPCPMESAPLSTYRHTAGQWRRNHKWMGTGGPVLGSAADTADPNTGRLRLGYVMTARSVRDPGIYLDADASMTHTSPTPHQAASQPCARSVLYGDLSQDLSCCR